MLLWKEMLKWNIKICMWTVVPDFNEIQHVDYIGCIFFSLPCVAFDLVIFIYFYFYFFLFLGWILECLDYFFFFLCVCVYVCVWLELGLSWILNHAKWNWTTSTWIEESLWTKSPSRCESRYMVPWLLSGPSTFLNLVLFLTLVSFHVSFECASCTYLFPMNTV